MMGPVAALSPDGTRLHLQHGPIDLIISADGDRRAAFAAAQARFGTVLEELVAELGSAFLSADLDLTPEPREDHAAYIFSWLKVLKNDKRAIFTAASKATKAAEYLNQFSEIQEQAA